jgi:hypothetical protein
VNHFGGESSGKGGQHSYPGGYPGSQWFGHTKSVNEMLADGSSARTQCHHPTGKNSA